MDEFTIEIDVQSYLTILDGRKLYRKGQTWEFVAGRDLSVAQIRTAVEEKFQWSANQRMTILYGSNDGTVPLISESEIVELFEMSTDKTVRFGVTIESKQPSNESNQGVPVKVDEENDELPHAPFFAWPNQAYDGQFEDDEPVGNDDEEEAANHHETEPEVAAARVPLGTLDVDNSYDEQYVPGNADGLTTNTVVPTHIHDKECPQIVVGATFPNSKDFKLALRKIAIIGEGSFNTEWSDTKKFRASCSDIECSWKIHASKLKDCNTFMVKRLPFAHTCGTSNNCDKKVKGKEKGRMTNKDWIAA